MLDVSHPFSFGPDGRTATASHSDHVLDLIEPALFTNPCERVNRPESGRGFRAWRMDRQRVP